MQNTYAYDLSGNLTSFSGSVANPFQFQGQYLDSVSNLYSLRARWYDIGSGQFMSIDPIDQSTRQPYTYATDNAVNVVDPTGLSWCTGCMVDIRMPKPLEYVVLEALSIAVYAVYYLPYRFNKAHHNSPLEGFDLALERQGLAWDESLDEYKNQELGNGESADDEGVWAPYLGNNAFGSAELWLHRRCSLVPDGEVFPGRHNGKEDLA